MQELATAPNSGLNFLQPKEVQTQKEERKGFSILDFLVILSAFLVIAFLGYLVVNPSKQGADMRNVHRSADISAILTSLTTYVNESGEIPASIPVSDKCVNLGNEICKTGPYDCRNLVDLSFLSDAESDNQEVNALPKDPLDKSINGTGYYISQDGAGSVTVCSPYAERNIEISFTKYMY